MSQAPPGPKGRGKSRIVIDVAKVQAEARAARGRGRLGFGRRGGGRGAGRRSRLPVVGLAALALILALLAGGYFWWQGYRRSPPYSLALLIDAAQHDDVRRVEELIDSDRVAEGFVPQVLDKLASGASA